MNLLTSDLLKTVLLEPLEHDANELCIVTGYTTANMYLSHFHIAKEKGFSFDVKIIYGMSGLDGIDLDNHKVIKELHGDKNRLYECYYRIPDLVPIHSKVYIWKKNGIPFKAFSGSANYTNGGFLGRQLEILSPVNPTESSDYFSSLIGDCIPCDNDLVNSNFVLYKGSFRKKMDLIQENDIDDGNSKETLTMGLSYVDLNLVQRKDGLIHARAGLNWGQRPERKRKNEAYIPVPTDIARLNFFPEKNIHFTILTDDGFEMIGAMVSGGEAIPEGKQIQTPLDNSAIGIYFRNRLSVPENAPVTDSDLERYGRKSVRFYKIDDDSYFMDFSR